MPFTDRVTAGRAIGRFIGGTYQSRVAIDGDVRQVFTRIEADRRTTWLGLNQRVRAGTVLRREWNAGPGEHTILTRATDAAGNTQPDRVPFNEKGYLFNQPLPHPISVV